MVMEIVNDQSSLARWERSQRRKQDNDGQEDRRGTGTSVYGSCHVWPGELASDSANYLDKRCNSTEPLEQKALRFASNGLLSDEPTPLNPDRHTTPSVRNREVKAY